MSIIDQGARVSAVGVIEPDAATKKPPDEMSGGLSAGRESRTGS